MKTALITGAARRIGHTVAHILHNAGWNLILHFNRSEAEAHDLKQMLNQRRANSVATYQADLNQMQQVKQLADYAQSEWGCLDAFIHNASSFYPTPFQSATEEQWHDLMNTNLKSPYFLTQYLLPSIKQAHGHIIYITDVNVLQTKKDYTIYCTAKAGLWYLIKAFAAELAPEIQVNGIAPGVILWGEGSNASNEEEKQQALETVPLKRIGTPTDIAETVLFLLQQNYITGQVLAVDGGRSICGKAGF